MSIRVNLNLPDATYQQVVRVADAQQKDVETVLEAVIATQFQPIVLDDQHDAMMEEIAAFHRLHPELVKTHFGMYVAVHGGVVVDQDVDLGRIADRIDANYPDDVVLVRRVEQEPERVIHVRSPRLTRN